ncbi:MAG TPA: AraC family transcriptional regulator ligand-binding domain-containing protein [Polyangiales bacterium]|nr:AraC family transcriptional regulator ligand-binding domain-containing protein [Polyangiales bacterium]
MLSGFWDELERRGVSSSELTRLSGVTRPRSGDFSTMISGADMYRLFDVSQALSRDPHIGLHVGRALGASGFHLIGHLVLASGTLRQAVSAILRVQPQIKGLSLRFDELEDGTLRVGFGVHTPPEHGARVEAELTAVCLHDVMLHFLADRASDRPEVELPFAAPADVAPYRRVFAGAVRFGSDGTFVSCRRSALARRRSGADPGLLQHLLDLALTQYAVANTARDWTSRVRSALSAEPMPRLIDTPRLAERLGVSVRGLSRRLAREGSNLSELLDETLYERARAMLRRRGTTAAQVAEALGYAELSSFFRAFRRWSGGLTPSAYRRLHSSADRTM